MGLADVLAQRRLALAGFAPHHGQRLGRGPQVGGGATQRLRLGDTGGWTGAGSLRHAGWRGSSWRGEAVRLDVDEQIPQLVGVQLDFGELDLGVFLPLGGDDLEHEVAQLSGAALAALGVQEVADGVVAREHLRVGPGDFPGCGVDAGVDVSAPPAVHRDPEVPTVVLQALVEPVHRSALTHAGARDVGQQVVATGAVAHEPGDVVVLRLDRGIQPGHRVANLPARRLDLIDQLTARVARRADPAAGVASAVGLSDGEAGDLGEGVGEQCAAQLLELLVAQPLIEVSPGSEVGRRFAPGRGGAGAVGSGRPGRAGHPSVPPIGIGPRARRSTCGRPQGWTGRRGDRAWLAQARSRANDSTSVPAAWVSDRAVMATTLVAIVRCRRTATPPPVWAGLPAAEVALVAEQWASRTITSSQAVAAHPTTPDRCSPAAMATHQQLPLHDQPLGRHRTDLRVHRVPLPQPCLQQESTPGVRHVRIVSSDLECSRFY